MTASLQWYKSGPVALFVWTTCINSFTNTAVAETSDRALETIVVTAQKREENLQDVPIPISVLQPDNLVATNSVGLRDFFSSVPGLSYNQAVGEAPVPVIRGINTGGFSNPATGITIDGAPFGTSTALGGGFTMIDLDPSDLRRIEVLRGPQGTLYGASSLGGLISYVTADPSLTERSGRITVGAQATESSDEAGYSLRLSYNAPLSDTVAARLSGFVKHDDGYIRDPIHNDDGANESDSYGLRLATLWRPSDDFSLLLNAIHQELELVGDQVDFRAPANSFVNSLIFPGYLGSDREFTFLSATARAGLGDVNLTSITGYTQGEIDQRLNFFLFANPNGFRLVVPGADAAPYQNLEDIEKFSQEVRVDGAFGARADWLFGLFYTKEEGEHSEFITSGDQLTGRLLAPRGDVFDVFYPSTYEERAAFGNFSIRFSEKFNIEFGMRYSENEQTLSSIQDGVLPDFSGPCTPCVTAPVHYEDESFTYSAAPQFHISSDFMIYARLATGYRAGGPNYNAPVTSSAATVAPDTTTNYELGVKGDLIDGLMSIDASLYRIDWDDIQVTAQDCASGCLTYVDNGGTAQVDGAEISVTLRPTAGLTLASWAAYSDAQITYVAPGVTIGASPGDRLPYGTEWSGNLSTDYEFQVSGALNANLGATVSYVGERLGNFAPAGRMIFDDYTQLDLRAGVEFRAWQLNAFVRNATDERGTLYVFVDSTTRTITRPRTFGISISTAF